LHREQFLAWGSGGPLKTINQPRLPVRCGGRWSREVALGVYVTRLGVAPGYCSCELARRARKRGTKRRSEPI
jgi:hypothetical protein